MSRKKRKKRKTTKKPQSHAHEIWGILWLAAAVFLILSFFSFQPEGVNFGLPEVDGKTANAGGVVGRFLSHYLFFGLGFACFLIPIILITVGASSLFTKDKKPASFFFWGIFLVFVTSGLFHALFEWMPWKDTHILSGGRIGQSITLSLQGTLNHIGSLILLLAGFVIGFVGFSRISAAKILRVIGKGAHAIFVWVKEMLGEMVSGEDLESVPGKKSSLPKKPGSAQKRKPEPKPKKIKPEKKSKPDKKSDIFEPEDVDEEIIPEALPKKKPAPFKVSKPEPLKPDSIPEPPLPPPKSKKGFRLPPLDFLHQGEKSGRIDTMELEEKKEIIEERLREFNVDGEVRECHPGPVITSYDFYPSSGIKVSKVASLSEEVALSLSAQAIRIHRTPGKPFLSVEAPNRHKELIRIRDIIESREFQQSKSKLTFAVGKDVEGNVMISDLAGMPHLLIAGATGSGKSVALNALIVSLLYRATPDEVKFIMIDPKRLELSIFEGIPHLMAPVVQNPKKAEPVLRTAILQMENRYKILQSLWVKNIAQYNQLFVKAPKKIQDKIESEGLEPLPYIVVVIDELAELMMVGAKEIEFCIGRLAQLARAVGIHLVLATQRPSIDVITGTIKNNFPCRMAFRVPAKVDSRIILDAQGAEHLLGEGDMLFIPPKIPIMTRLHGAYVDLTEIKQVVEFLKEQQGPEYDQKLVNVIEKSSVELEREEDEEKDALFDEAVALILQTGQASASYLQRRMSVGYARAARLIDQMEAAGIVGPADGSKPREILVDSKDDLPS